ncbi:hypothetical protein [Brucella abortus]|uniref:hypothetical protein n=1 Tax=Brucella abortus TaxID=235 RepID=UPI0001B4A57F|nr:hypothetical protein [Brucella abortus]AIJ91925.1 hypothetical protein DK55_1943 [Brucella abortus bv. 2 str. 86/8/59]ENP99031.1 hypothetical protein C984_01884 [Brucella abortus F3/01-300]
MKKLLRDIKPFIIDNSDLDKVSISKSSKTIITCESWDHIRSTQIATLYINKAAITSIQLLSLNGRFAAPPVFSITTEKHFRPCESYEIFIEVTEPDGSDNPNQSRSASLIVDAMP